MRAKSRITAQVTTVIALPFVVGMLAACSSSSTTAATVPPGTLPPSSAATTTTSSAPADSPGSAPAVPTTFAAAGTATGSQGDKATVSVSVGKPVPQLSLNQPNLAACSGMDNITDGDNQTMAIPVQITVTLTSSIATDVIVAIDGTHVVAPGGNASTTSWPTMWATDDNNSACVDDGSLEWHGVASGQAATWSGWELDPEVITPNDPSGSAVNQVFFLEPVVNFGNGNAGFTADAAHSQNLLNCSAGVQGGPVIAVDPSVARANGCTAYTGS